ncbi:MAG: zinc-dependent metalloprotease [Elusimicrobia bacterium]|nr:zinc-dependent metalloprotease [Elusimicrobiota bacterium]
MNPRFLAAAFILLSFPRGARAEDALMDIGSAVAASVEKARQTRPLFAVTRVSQGPQTRRSLTIRLDQMDVPYLFSSTLERGSGEDRIFSTMMDDTFLCSFRLSGDRVLFVRRQTGYKADPGTPEHRAVARSIADEALAVLPVLSSDAAKGQVVVSADELFLRDLTGVKAAVAGRGEGRAAELRQGDSALERLDAYPKNLEVQAHLVYSVSEPRSRLIAVTMRYSITKLPDGSDFEPRPADPRVGHFTESVRNLSRPDLKQSAEPVEHLINRWNLRKKEPAAPVSEAVEPVVFWLDDTIPELYRPAIKAGILAWNEALENVGLLKALQVKEVDKDLSPEARASFDPADISYNMIRWFVGEGSTFAVGPSRANPLTGELFHASISVGDAITRFIGKLDLIGRRPPAAKGDAHNDEAMLREARREAAASLALLEARGDVPESEIKRYQDEYIAHIMMHEVGHTLGLRHNFKGSSAVAAPSDGLYSTSVMDYLPPRIAPPGSPQGAYFQTKVGPYDAWAIEYSYKTLNGTKEERKAALAAIAARAETDSQLAYATDEEVDGIDPYAQRFDSGKEPLDFSRARVALAKDLFKRLESESAGAGQNPARLRERFSAGMSAYLSAAGAALPFIGGVRSNRGAGVQFEPVPAAKQREALAFLETELFEQNALSASPELLRRLGNSQLGYGIKMEPYPMAAVVLDIQKTALEHLYAEGTLRRLTDQELYVGDPMGRFTPGEMMERVRRAVWTEVGGKAPAPVNLYRRNLQREHLGALSAVLKNAGMPVDARSVARRDLERIARDVSLSLPSAGDETTRLHLQEMLRGAREILKGFSADKA